MTYTGYERNRLISNDKEEYITETMQEFLEFVKERDPNLLPKIKIIVGDFLSDQNIPTKELVNEDELEMLDKWIKSVKGEENVLCFCPQKITTKKPKTP